MIVFLIHIIYSVARYLFILKQLLFSDVTCYIVHSSLKVSGEQLTDLSFAFHFVSLLFGSPSIPDFLLHLLFFCSCYIKFGYMYYGSMLLMLMRLQICLDILIFTSYNILYTLCGTFSSLFLVFYYFSLLLFWIFFSFAFLWC